MLVSRSLRFLRRLSLGLGLLALLTACARPQSAPTAAPTPTITVPALPTRGPSPTPEVPADVPVGPAVGQLAPDFSLMGLEAGPAYTLRQWQGTPLVLNFWATWCPPCVEELPMLADYATHYQGRVVFIALNVDESSVRVQRFVQTQGLAESPLVFLRDPTGAVSLAYRVNGFPTTFFLDAQGIIRYIRIGGMREADLKAGLQAILEAAP